MKNNAYKITVFSDLNSATHKILKTTVKLAKIINGEIEIFTIKKPSEIVDIDNQLSAMRSINTEHSVIDKKLKKLIGPISEEYEFDLRYSYTFGNLKNEIIKYIKDRNPDIIVLGRRKNRRLSFVGDGITEFVLNTFRGPVLIASGKHALEPGKKLSLGVLNGTGRSLNLEFAEDLMAYVQKPTKSFTFVKNSESSKTKKISQDKEIIEYIFEYNDGAINSLSKYIAKNNIDLLYISRGKEDSDEESNLNLSDFWRIINKTKISVLISGK